MGLTPEEELLVTDWFRRARESQKVHYECGTRYSRLNYWLGIPTIILSTTVGTVVFATLDRQAAGWIKVALGLTSVAAAVLAALQTFLSFGRLADQHKLAGSKYGAVRRSLELLKSVPPEREEDIRSTLAKIKKELDELAENTPHVPSRLKLQINTELKGRDHKRIFDLPKSN